MRLFGDHPSSRIAHCRSRPALEAAEQLGPLAGADEGPDVRVEGARASAAPLVA
jgi:hypothetical protein